MTSKNLNREQLERIIRAVQSHQRYLNRLTGRMHQTHFPQDDPIRVEAERARESVERLCKVLGEFSVVPATRE